MKLKLFLFLKVTPQKIKRLWLPAFKQKSQHSKGSNERLFNCTIQNKLQVVLYCCFASCFVMFGQKASFFNLLCVFIFLSSSQISLLRYLPLILVFRDARFSPSTDINGRIMSCPRYQRVFGLQPLAFLPLVQRVHQQSLSLWRIPLRVWGRLQCED